MNEYEVGQYYTVTVKNTRIVYDLKRRFTLPFAPHKGIDLHIHADDSAGGEPVERVVWVQSEQTFWCKMGYCQAENEQEAIEIVDDIIKLGWVLESSNAGTNP